MTRFTLRIPSELHDKFIQIAAEQERSLNAQILYALKMWAQGVSNAGLPVELESSDSTVKREVSVN